MMPPTGPGQALLRSLRDGDVVCFRVRRNTASREDGAVIHADGTLTPVSARTASGLANQLFLRWNGRVDEDDYYVQQYVLSPKGRAWLATDGDGAS